MGAEARNRADSRGAGGASRAKRKEDAGGKDGGATDKRNTVVEVGVTGSEDGRAGESGDGSDDRGRAGRRRSSSRAFGRMSREGCRVISEGALGAVRESKLSGVQDAVVNETVAATGEGVDIEHHTPGPVDDGEVVAQQLLGPPTNHVDGSVVGEDFFHGGAVADPIKENTPEMLFVFGNGPTTTGGFSNERMEVTLLLGALAGVEFDGPEAGTAEGEIEGTDTSLSELEGGGDGSRTIIGLHKDGAETVGAPIGFEEDGLGTIVAGEAGAGSNAYFHIVEELTEIRSPSTRRDGFAVVGFDQPAEGLEF